ncbi:MAG TPA: dienelactone hydrolase family protein [Candidatus Sulfotelmatobacter sp.]|nr:dienelactone hydrolase family protein [Candidatus Sulfotelmatobacter sp.]
MGLGRARGVVAALLILCASSADGRAGQLVAYFADWQEVDPQPVIGYLARPEGAGRFPAVVVLHGCAGFGASVVDWADRLAGWGYVALAVDSYGPRKLAGDCGQMPYQAIDAYLAADHLSREDFVDRDRMAVLGLAMGGTAVLMDAERGTAFDGPHPRAFRAAVALHPDCGAASGIMTMPTLILIGARGAGAAAEACRAMAAGRTVIGANREPGDRSMVRLTVYPDADDGVDARGAARGAAATDALQRVRDFLAAGFKR